MRQLTFQILPINYFFFQRSISSTTKRWLWMTKIVICSIRLFHRKLFLVIHLVKIFSVQVCEGKEKQKPLCYLYALLSSCPFNMKLFSSITRSTPHQKLTKDEVRNLVLPSAFQEDGMSFKTNLSALVPNNVISFCFKPYISVYYYLKFFVLFSRV